MNNLNFYTSIKSDNIYTISLYKRPDSLIDDPYFIGYFIGSISYSFTNNLLYISDFLVKEDYRKKGYGTKLVQYLLDNVSACYSEYVVHCNDQSINIFKKLGFNEKEKYTILTK